jgi:geranylgeranyl reductase family protein
MGNAVTTWDAVVAGAGPAGATAARHLAAAGGRVLLLDAAPLGRHKPCGGGLTARALAELDLALLGDLPQQRVDTAEVRCGARSRLRFALGDGAVAMVCRDDFDRRLAEAAVAAGAQLHDREALQRVDACDGGDFIVHTARAAYRARVLLLAGGGDTRLGDAVGIPAPPATMAPALEMEGRGVARDLDADTLLFDYDAAGGYAWAFPRQDGWNVGVLTTRSHPGAALRRRLHTALAHWGVHFDDATALRATGRRIPLWRGRRGPLHRGRAALLGDAAALADPFFGEGIAAALLSGRLAAAAAGAVLEGRSEDMAPYTAAAHAALDAHQRRARLAARLVYARPAMAVRALRLLPPLRAFAAQLSVEPLGDGA